MKRKMDEQSVRFVAGLLLGGFGFLLVIGTAGSAELEQITFTQAIIQAVIGTVCMTVGGWLGGFLR